MESQSHSSSRLTPEETQRVVEFALDRARAGDTAELVDFVEHGLPVDVWDHDHNSLLMLAAYHGRLDTVRALIALGADVDLRNSRQQSPLAGALFKGEDEVVALLLAAGADPDAGIPSARQTAEMFGRQDLLEG